MNIEKQILEAIKKYDTIIIHRHMRPDPDALGSQSGLREIIRANFPEKTVYVVGHSVDDMEYLAEMDEIADEVYQGALVIVTDTANSPRISDERFDKGDLLIKIDHHPNDEPYGDIVYVDTSVSSSCELITRWAKDLELKFNGEAARLLYAGIIGDTGRFLYPSSTSKTLETAAFLQSYDFDATYLKRQISQIPLSVARLSGFVYLSIDSDENGVARVVLNKELLEEFGVHDGQTSHVVALPGQVDSILCWAIFVEQPDGKYRVRIRSKGPVINTIAKRHDGGGHPLASGANAVDLEECEEIYQELQAAGRDYRGQA